MFFILFRMMDRYKVTAGLNNNETVKEEDKAELKDEITCKITGFDSPATSSKKSPKKLSAKSPRFGSPSRPSPGVRRLLRKRKRQQTPSFSSSPQKPYLLRSMRSSEINMNSPTNNKTASSSNSFYKSSSSPIKKPVR